MCRASEGATNPILDFQVLGVGLAVGCILPDAGFPSATAKKSSFTATSLALLPVSSAEEPIVARLAGDDEMLGHGGVEDAGVVPDGGHDLQEIRARLVPVVAGMIADADDRAFIQTNSASSAQRVPCTWCGFRIDLELVELAVQETARREVGRARPAIA